MSDRTAQIVASILKRRGIPADASEIQAEMRRLSRRGGEPAWRTELRQRRDDLMRTLRFYVVPPEASEHRAAQLMQIELAKCARRYARRRRPVISGHVDEIRFEIFEIGLPVPTGLTTIKKTLRSRR